jgi:phenylacetate-CoA ligase
MLEELNITNFNKQVFNMNSIGSNEEAWKIFNNMYHSSKAYQKFIQEKLRELNKSNIDELNWDEIPIITKKEFYSAYEFQEILPKDSYKDIYTFYRSSGTTAGTTGRGFFWPQLKSDFLNNLDHNKNNIIDLLNLKQKSTLFIIGLSLGSWAGGEQLSFYLKDLALKNNLSLSVFSPGNMHAEIVEIIEKLQHDFEQIIIALCPSAIFYLERLANSLNIRLPLEKITFFVGGEPFPETLRTDLQKRSQKSNYEPSIVSIYGSADAGIMGMESKQLIIMRQLIAKTPEMAKLLGFTPSAIPNLFHLRVNHSKIYLEEINNELVITKWQGLPLIKYNIQDKCKFFSWEKLCLIAASFDKSEEDLWIKRATEIDGEIFAIWGRSKGCIFLCGSNIFETMLQEVVFNSSLSKIITGSFVVWVELMNGRQTLHWQIELKNGEQEPKYDIHSEFVKLLSEQQPEFADDYEKFYRPFENEGMYIFQFHFCKDKTLSENGLYNSGIKKKVIIEKGPI